MIVVEHVTKKFERFINKHKKEEFFADEDISFKAKDGEIIGTTGADLKLEALRIDPLGTAVKAKAHIQDKGWIDYGEVDKDTIIGTVGENKAIECLCLEGDFEWRAHLAESGWTDWTEADAVATLGTVGQALQMEAIQIRRK